MKLRFILSVLLALGFSVAAMAQNAAVRTFEFEAGGQILWGNGTRVDYSSKGPGWDVYVEPRINIPGTGWDVAAHFAYGSLRRSNPMNDDGKSLHSRTVLLPIIVFCDYSFRGTSAQKSWRGKVVPFCGIGIGAISGVLNSAIAWADVYGTTGGPTGYHDERFAYTLCPRVGCELFDRLRLTVDYRLTNQPATHICSTVNISLGLVIGGGHKEKRISAKHEKKD